MEGPSVDPFVPLSLPLMVTFSQTAGLFSATYWSQRTHDEVVNLLLHSHYKSSTTKLLCRSPCCFAVEPYIYSIPHKAFSQDHCTRYGDITE
jgi:hypothetical protein